MAKQTFTTGQVLTAAQMTSLQQTAMLGGSASAKVASYTLVAADAGTTVSMSNASATTITVNTGLFAAGDIVTILNVGAGTCTITAGTATVSKPTNATLALVTNAGGVLYFTATGAATFLPFDVGSAATTLPLTTKGDLFGYDTANARIPIGTNNQVLTADSAQALGLKWATPTAVARSYSLLGTGTTTSGTTVTVSGISGINSIYVLFNAISTDTAGLTIGFRINGDSGNNYSYFGGWLAAQSPYAISNYQTAEQTATANFRLSQNSAIDSVMSGGLTIEGCNSSGLKLINAANQSSIGAGAYNTQRIVSGAWSGSATVSSVSLFIASGAFDAGAFYVYGSA